MTSCVFKFIFLEPFPQVKKHNNLDPGVKPQDDEEEKLGGKIRHNDLGPGVKPQDDKSE